MAKIPLPLASVAAPLASSARSVPPTDRDRNEASMRSFRLLFELGRGGMARVYLAESLASGIQKLVVLKILNHELARDAAMRAAFLREAELSGRMNHPNVVQVYEVLEHQATDVIVMEYVDGFPLSRIALEKKNELSLRLHLSIVLQMLSGLHYFHELHDLDGSALHGVHRDVSPHNVLVSHDGPTKVADFGIAKVNLPVQFATQTGLVKGKIHYMAPEQMLGDEVDRRADIFSAGVILWEAVAQRRMWAGRDSREIMQALTRGQVPLLDEVKRDAPPGLIEVARRATAVMPKDRYATALEMMEATERAMNEGVGVAQHRELAEFMTRAFGDLREIQQRGVNRALRNTGALQLGVLDCWTAGHATKRTQGADSRPRPAPQATEDTDLVADLSSASLDGALNFSTESALPLSLSGLTASGATVLEPARAPAAARSTRKLVLGATALLALILSAAAWLLPAPVLGHQRGVARPAGLAATTTLAAAKAVPEASSPLDARAVEWEQVQRPRREPDGQPLLEPIAGKRESVSPVEPRPAHHKSLLRAPSRSVSDCSPPYRLLPNGVKSFKPECFTKPAASR
jgi:serine/threonine-protein kinase